MTMNVPESDIEPDKSDDDKFRHSDRIDSSNNEAVVLEGDKQPTYDMEEPATTTPGEVTGDDVCLSTEPNNDMITAEVEQPVKMEPVDVLGDKEIEPENEVVLQPLENESVSTSTEVGKQTDPVSLHKDDKIDQKVETKSDNQPLEIKEEPSRLSTISHPVEEKDASMLPGVHNVEGEVKKSSLKESGSSESLSKSKSESRSKSSHDHRHSRSHHSSSSRSHRSAEHSSSSSRRKSDEYSRHSSRCASRKEEGGRCDCDRKRSHRSADYSSRSSSSKKPSKYNLKIQVNVAELHGHMKKMRLEQKTPLTAESRYIPTRVPWVPHETITKFKYQELFRVEEDPNGGASICHLYWDEISHLPENKLKEIAQEFIMLSYSEDDDQNAYHVIGIVHGAADYLPDLLDYMADHYPGITVKVGSLTGRGTQSITMGEYRDEVYKTYCNGTFRYAPLQELSICGVVGEEVGAYFPDFVKKLEKSPTMFPVMPWSYLSVVRTDNPRESNDGPIFWVRPGEQLLPSSDASRSKGRLAKGVSRLSEAREALFEDRTKPHADQIGIDGGDGVTAPTAAVGLLKAVNCGHPEHRGRATKDVVAFHAKDYDTLLDLLQIDVYEPPLRQCTMWLETAKLNSLRRQGIRFAHIQLHDGDVYYLPRKIIHQFQTISAVASVAWHVRFLEYFKKTGAPNLHTPTGLNKGSVYYEKTNVPKYEPPAPEEDPEDDIILSKSPRKRYRRRSEGEEKRTEKKVKVETPVKSSQKSPFKTPVKGTPQVLQPLSARESRPKVMRPSETEKSPNASPPRIPPPSEGAEEKTLVTPIKLEKAPGEKNFTVVPKTPEKPRPVNLSPEKLLKENIEFKKKKSTAKSEEKICDVLGAIMSQMKKAKKE